MNNRDEYFQLAPLVSSRPRYQNARELFRKKKGFFKSRSKKKTKAEFLEDKKKILTNSGKEARAYSYLCSYLDLFLFVFPISHGRRGVLYKRTLKFNKENVTVILLLP